MLFWLVDWLLGSMQERNRFYVQSEGGARDKFSGRESLRRTHIGQTLGSWDFGELRVLKCKSKEALAST